MVNMQMSQEEQDEYQETAMTKKPLYPWGLCLTLDDDALKKLGISLPTVDQVMEFRCKAQVTSASSVKASDEETCECVSLQITDMEVVEEKKTDIAMRLYGGKA